MTSSLFVPLVLAVTPQALFDLREEGRPSGADGQAPLRPGSAFRLVRKLLALDAGGRRQVEVVLVSAGSADSGLHVLHSLAHHGLPVERAIFTDGAPCHRYATALGAGLFLSTDAGDVRLALDQGMPAATMVEGTASGSADSTLRIAFDGDAVLFSDEAEQVYARSGLDAFVSSEQAARLLPLAPGPLQPFFAHLHRLKTLYGPDACPVRTALVTARGVAAHERALRTLRAWGIGVDEAMFLAGADKGPALRSFGADIFFDDQKRNCDGAAAWVPCAHVPYGTRNQPARPELRRVA